MFRPFGGALTALLVAAIAAPSLATSQENDDKQLLERPASSRSSACCPNGMCCCLQSFRRQMSLIVNGDPLMTRCSGNETFDSFQYEAGEDENVEENPDGTQEHHDISDVFLQYNYSYQNIPRTLSHLQVDILSEDLIRYFRDFDGEYFLLGKGTFGEVYLAEIIKTKSLVAVKIFLDSDFEEIKQEVVINLYLQDTGVVPRVLGIVPAGPLMHNISVVQEYVNGLTLDDYLEGNADGGFLRVEWLNISLQLAVGLEKFHQKYVLLNDLHPGNVLVEAPGPRVVYIDMGHAQFRSGFHAKGTNRSLYNYKHLAPEYQGSQSLTPATDVYSLGILFQQIANASGLSELRSLAGSCAARLPRERPALAEIIARLREMFRVESEKQQRETPRFADFAHVRRRNPTSMKEYPVPVLDPTALYEPLNGTSGAAITMGGVKGRAYVAKLQHCKCQVVVRWYENSSYDKIIEEAQILIHLKESGFVFSFHGFLPAGSFINNFRFVYTHVPSAVSLATLMEDYLIEVTQMDAVTLFIHLSLILLECHRKGVLLNYLNEVTVTMDTEEEEASMWINDVSRATFNSAYRYPEPVNLLSDFRFLAPEVRNGSWTSPSSDVYSLCYVFEYTVERAELWNMTDLVKRCMTETPEERLTLPEIITELRKYTIT